MLFMFTQTSGAPLTDILDFWWLTLSMQNCQTSCSPRYSTNTKNVTRVASHKHKKLYDDNLWAFHKVRGVKQYLIQQFYISIDKKYIIAIKNLTTGQFTGNIYQIFA